MFGENSRREINWLSQSFAKKLRFHIVSFQNVFPSTLRRRAGVFKFLRFQERLWKAAFSWWISVDGRPNRTNKTTFSNSSGVSFKAPSKQTEVFTKLTILRQPDNKTIELILNEKSLFQTNVKLNVQMVYCAIIYFLSWQHSLIVLNIFSVLTQMFCYFIGSFSNVEFNDI